MGQGKGQTDHRREKTVLTTFLSNYSSFLVSAGYFILVIGILVFVHELGHFLLAKKLGVGVITFSLGFGPKLIGRKIGETQYQISAIPLGGYVKLIGEDRGEELKEEDRARSFSSQPIWKRTLIICAGPFFNIFLTLVIYCFSFGIFGLPQEPLPLPPKIGGLSSGLPAEKAGLKQGDLIISIDNMGVTTWDDVVSIVRKSEGKELSIKIKRNGEMIEFKIIPEISKDPPPQGEKTLYVIGIVAPLEEMTFRYKRIGPLEAIYEGSLQTWHLTKLMMVVLWKMVSGDISPKTIGGPIQIAQEAGKQGKKGIPYLLGLIAILGINLGLINLFPIPILDGGHLLFLGIEAILGKPVSIKKMEIAQQIGLVLIILLMIYAFHNDLRRLFFPRGYGF
ncbi:MAG: RIP metalloprotease RseP [Deltaproteobacteria bacterium]|nr:RIP metalloprotease RseP [Deltaproteobacteria bacterium]MBM4346956.1 RIP metalloprotease RseP [Deltaproteobacteria bacterium]